MLEDVLVDAGPNIFTITLNTSAAINRLDLLSPEATLLIDVTGHLASTLGGTLRGDLLLRRGHLTGGAWQGDGGRVFIEQSGSRISNATFNDLDLVLRGSFASLNVEGPLDINGGSLRLESTESRVTFEDSQTIDFDIVSLSTTPQSHLLFGNASTNTVAQNASILVQAGTLGLNGVSGAGGVSLVNQGLIRAAGAGRYAVRNGVEQFTNTGSLVGSGEVSAANWTNEGSIRTDGGGVLLAGSWVNNAEIDIANGALTTNGVWTNNGTIRLTNSQLTLGGAFTTVDVDSIERTNTTLRALNAAWNNAGSTLDFGSIGLFDARSSEIVGGTIIVPEPGGFTSLSLTLKDLVIDGGIRVGAGSNRVNTTLDGVSFINGGLTVDGGTLNLRGDTTIDTSLTVLSPSSPLSVIGSLTLGSGATVTANSLTFESSESSPGTVRNHTSLVLGGAAFNDGVLGITERLDRFVNHGTIDIGRYLSSGASDFENHGEIDLGGIPGYTSRFSGLTNSGTITLRGDHALLIDGAWNNSGGIIDLGAEGLLRLDGSGRTSDLGTFARTGGTVALGATIDNAGQTITLADATGLWSLAGATIIGGFVDRPGGPSFQDGDSINLIDVTLLGGDLHIMDTNVGLGGSFTLGDGDEITISRSPNEFSSLRALGDLTLDGVELNGTGGQISIESGGTLTLGSDVRLTGRNFSITSGDRFTNHGLIEPQGTLAIGTSVAINESDGVIRANPGATISIGGVGSHFENHGLVEAAAGVIDIAGGFENTGQIRAGTGEVRFTGVYDSDSFGDVAASGSGRIVLGGTIDNVGRILNPNALLGRWDLRGATINGGVIDLAGTNLHTVSGVLRDVEVRGGDMLVEGDITFQGSSRLTAGNRFVLVSPARLMFSDAFTISNDVRMAAGSRMDLISGGAVAEGVTVSGAGEFDFSGPFENLGTVRADGGSLILRSRSGSGRPLAYNRGILEAVDGGNLSVEGVFADLAFVNESIIRATDASLGFGRSWENRGTIQATRSNVVFFEDVSTEAFGDIEAVDSTFHMNATWDNTGYRTNIRELFGGGPLEVGSGLGRGRLEGGTFVLDDEHTLTFGGLSTVLRNVALEGPGVFGITTNVSILDTLTMGGGQLAFAPTGPRSLGLLNATLDGVDLVSTARFQNYVTIQANSTSGGSNIVEADSAIRGGGIDMRISGPFINQGLIAAERIDDGSRFFEISVAGSFLNQGTVIARNGGMLEIEQAQNIVNYQDGTLTGGRWIVEGASSIDMPGISIVTNNATIELHGAGSEFDALDLLSRNEGRFAVLGNREFRLGGAAGPFVNAGELVVEGQFSARRLTLEDEGVATLILSDAIASTPLLEGRISLRLGGSLDVLLGEDLLPSLGDSFALLGSDSILGEFESILLPTLGGGLRWELAATPTAWGLTVVPAPGACAVLCLGIGGGLLRRR